MKITYNKLVRDHIPTIIKNDNKQCKTQILDKESYKQQLKEKLVEEAKEVQQTHTNEELIKEIADILEVLEALTNTYNLSQEDILSTKQQKAQKNGQFNKHIYLEYVIED